MMVFKLDRERPSFAVLESKSDCTLFFYKDRNIKQKDLKRDGGNALEYAIVSLSRGRGRNAGIEAPRSLHYNSYNPSSHTLILFSEEDGGKYELFNVKKGVREMQMQGGLTGKGKSVAFTTRNRFAVLDRNQNLSLRNLQNEIKRDIPFSENINYVFPAGIGKVLLRAPDRMIL